jgi:penicillin amidase
LDSVYRLLLAQSADELEAAMREWTEPVNNVVYADIHGQYGHHYRGRIPLRPMANAWRPVPGWTGAYEWEGHIPFDHLPQVRNPSAGFVATCNNRVTTDDYPYYINTYFQSDFRVRRVTARLQALSPGMATIDDMAAIHADLLSIPAQIFVGVLPQVESADARVLAARDLLLPGDCQMTRASAAAAIYAVARTYLYTDIITHAFENLAAEALGAPGGTGRGPATHAGLIYTRAITAMESGDTALLPAGKTWAGLIESALRRAIDELEHRLGGEMTEWTWGRIHNTRPRHPLSRVFPELASYLDPPGVAVGSDADTPQQGGYSHTERFAVTLLSVNRYIHDPADWRRSRWIVPLGASGHPGSPHYADQIDLWAQMQTIPQLWDWADIQAAAETQKRLEPNMVS